MSNEIVFRTQLTSIMEVLANAAVEEICKLVNDGYAILNLEISEYQKENESLKMQLHMMELKAAQGCVERVTARENSLTNCFDGAAGENPRGTSKEGPNLAAKRVFGSSRGLGPPAPHRIRDQFAETENTRTAPVLIKEENSEECSDPKTDLDIHGQGASEPSAGDAEVDPVAMGVEVSPSPVRADEMDELHGTGHSVWECADMEEGRTEPLLIKEEKLEEESDPLGDLIREERAVELRPGGGERPPIQEVQNKAANHPEELSEQHRTRHGVWEVSGLEPVLKAEAETESAHQGENQQRTGGLNHLDSELVMFDRPGQLETYSMQGNGEVDSFDPSEINSQSALADSELQSGPITEEGRSRKSLSSKAPQDAEPEGVVVDCAPFEMEVMQSVWNMETCSGMDDTQHRHGRGEHTPNVCAPYTDLMFTESAAMPQSEELHANGQQASYENNMLSVSPTATCGAGTRKERYVCKCCGKSCTRASGLRAHQRVHTGEKPFSCTLCGKKFADSSNLRKHKNIHTGEKLFSCVHCGKKFNQSYNLKTHMRIHTKGRWFSCEYCWQVFSESSLLKLHQKKKHSTAFSM